MLTNVIRSSEVPIRKRESNFNASSHLESYQIVKDTEDPVTTIEVLVEELPDNSPRYVVLSYPIKLLDGRMKNPLVLVYWRPPTCGQESKMLYAGAVELMREKAGVSQLIEIDDEEDFEDIEERLN